MVSREPTLPKFTTKRLVDAAKQQNMTQLNAFSREILLNETLKEGGLS